MKKQKRVLSILLVALLVLALAPTAALAAEEAPVEEIPAEALVEEAAAQDELQQTEEDDYVPVERIYIGHEAFNLKGLGDGAQMQVEVVPENATNYTMEWSSSNPAVATVDNMGNVKAVGYGSTVITVKSLDPLAKDSPQDQMTVWVDPTAYGPQGTGGNQALLVYPGNVTFDTHSHLGYHNTINEPVTVVTPMQFQLRLTNDMQGVDEDFITKNILPKIKFAKDDVGYGTLDIPLTLNDYDSATNTITFSIPEYSLEPFEQYVLWLQHDMAGTNPANTLGDEIEFYFTTNEASNIPRVEGLTAVANYADSLLLEWDKVEGAAGYTVYLYGKEAVTVEENRCTLDGISAATVEEVRVAAYIIQQSGDDSDKVDGPRSDLLVTATCPDNVKGIKAAKATPNALTLQWNTVRGAAGYDILNTTTMAMVRVPAGKGSTQSYQLKGLGCGRKYGFKITPYLLLPDGKTEINGENTGNTFLCTPMAKVTGLKYTSKTNKSVNVTWKVDPYAQFYRVYVNNKKVTTIKVHEGDLGNKYTVKGLKPNTKYSIKVCAVNRDLKTSIRGDSAAIRVQTRK